MYNKVELCGVNTGQLPVLTEAEKRQLLTLAHAGDKAARARMVEGNLRLVLSVVQRFAQRGENLDDLFQVGCIGLIKSIDIIRITQIVCIQPKVNIIISLRALRIIDPTYNLTSFCSWKT